MFLAINGVTVPVNPSDVETDVEEHVDAGRGVDGTLTSRELAPRKLTYIIRTRWLTPAEYTAVLGELEAAPPAAVTGDLVGAGFDSVPRIRSTRTTQLASGIRRSIEFLLPQV